MPPVKMTRAEYEAKFGTSVPSTSAAPVQMTKAQYQAKYGVEPGQEQNGFFKNLISAPATILARPLQLGQELVHDVAHLGQTSKTQSSVDALNKENEGLVAQMKAMNASGQDSSAIRQKVQSNNDQIVSLQSANSKNLNFEPFHGGPIAAAPKNAADVEKDIGRGAQTVALGLGPVSGGALFGAGNSLEQGNNLFSGQTALQTVLGAGAGKFIDLLGKPLLNAAGKVVGKITPQVLEDVVGKGAGAVSDFMKQHQAPEAIQKIAGSIESGAKKVDTAAKIPFDYVGKKLTPSVSKAEQDLADKYTELFTGQSSSKEKAFNKAQRVAEMKNTAGTQGTPPQQTLAKAHIIPEVNGDKLSTLNQAEKFRSTAKPLRDANRNALKQVEYQTQPISLADQEEKAVALAKTPENINNGTAKDLEKEIRQEYADLREHYGENVPITTLDDIKSARWGKTPFNGTRPLLGNANYLIAKAAQGTIQDTAESVGAKDVAQLNRHIGDIFEGAKFLEDLNGKTVNGGGLTKHALRLGGALLGHSIPGKIAGALGGDLVANMLISNEIASPVKRLILRNLEATDPEAYKATLAWLKSQGIEADLRPRLSAPKPQAPLGSPENPHIAKAPSRTVYEPRAQKVNRQKLADYLQLPAGRPGTIPGETVRLPNSARATNMGTSELESAKIKNPADRRKNIKDYLKK